MQCSQLLTALFYGVELMQSLYPYRPIYTRTGMYQAISVVCAIQQCNWRKRQGTFVLHIYLLGYFLHTYDVTSTFAPAVLPSDEIS